MLETKKQAQEKSAEYCRRLANLHNFLHIICIEGGCGYDLKSICSDMIIGKIDYNEALAEWRHCGHKIFS